MSKTSLPLFREDAELRECQAQVIAVNDRGGIVLDRTVFYATSGGQPGDTGDFILAGGSQLGIGAAIYVDGDIVHVPSQGPGAIKPGDTITARLNWPRRLAHMRMHTALHLLCSLVPYPVTGGSIGEADSRLDFDIADAGAVDKAALSAQLATLVVADHRVTTRWISEDELATNPSLVRTMSVQPPKGSGTVRLVAIGEDDAVDLQPCGGTHVRSTGEIGAIHVGKIEKKGRQNRRIRVRFGESQ
ncbi:MAG: alanyl-tRNA editing protein [Alphaproteobacteria bacterium]